MLRERIAIEFDADSIRGLTTTEGLYVHPDLRLDYLFDMSHLPFHLRSFLFAVVATVLHNLYRFVRCHATAVRKNSTA